VVRSAKPFSLVLGPIDSDAYFVPDPVPLPEPDSATRRGVPVRIATQRQRDRHFTDSQPFVATAHHHNLLASGAGALMARQRTYEIVFAGDFLEGLSQVFSRKVRKT
jgi:phosphatidylserine/phosphatidylglycerophosphate/cardiolipin synthase-like enzyme